MSCSKMPIQGTNRRVFARRSVKLHVPVEARRPGPSGTGHRTTLAGSGRRDAMSSDRKGPSKAHATFPLLRGPHSLASCIGGYGVKDESFARRRAGAGSLGGLAPGRAILISSFGLLFLKT